MFNEKAKSWYIHKEKEEETRCLGRGITAGWISSFFCMRTCNALIVGVCRASNLHLIIYYYLLFLITYLSLSPHFPCKTTQIITLDVIKHDQVNFANVWLFCLDFDIFTGIPQLSADSAAIWWFRSHLEIPQPFCCSQGSTCHFSKWATWALRNQGARGSCAIGSAIHVICTSGQQGSSYGQ